MSSGAEYRPLMRLVGALVRREHSPQRALPFAILLATMAAAMSAPGAAFAQSCTGQCVFDRLLLRITAPAADQTNLTGKPADREGAP
jgi:hypothetical protein